ncbi:hypothetical protein P879_11897 [Paragonimus westermani]|uniref:Ubiquitin-like domain-containing protein n=1 Tax=Paragonimus westermani TaxID=34504 RepID=A0A8T0D8W6_9TREM|nr:hypothetical protein P879_11897 [Paragonimus westermani]
MPTSPDIYPVEEALKNDVIRMPHVAQLGVESSTLRSLGFSSALPRVLSMIRLVCIPVTQQHLIWQESELDDHHRLRDYSISGGSTIRLVLGLRGGPLNAHRVPPLRLTPIHLTPSLPPKYEQPTAACNGRMSHLSRFNLPALASSRMLPKYYFDSTRSDSTKCLSSDTDDKKSTSTPNQTNHTAHAKVVLPGLSTQQTEDQSIINVKRDDSDDALSLSGRHVQTASDAPKAELSQPTAKG